MALDNSSSETRPQVRGENNNRPNGLTRDYSIDRGLYESALNSVSSNVVDALRLSNLGVDPTMFKKMFSIQEKISYETVTELDELSIKFQKYLDSAQTDREKTLVQMEYQSKLDELREEKNRQLEEELKKDDIERMSAFFEKTTSVLEENDTSIRGALLGPLNLITKPFEEFFGFDIGKSMRELLFGGKSKKNPTESDVAKIGLAGAGYLYIANTIKSVFGEDKDKALPSIIPKIGMPRLGGAKVKVLGGTGFAGLLSSGISKLFSSLFVRGGLFTRALKDKGLLFALRLAVSKGLTKAGAVTSIGGIVTSLLSMITSGIIGAMKSKENNVSGFSGFLGSFFAGNSSGIKGALSGMGKWGMMGFSVGLKLAPMTGGISLIVGPLLGLVVGGVLGAIGGAKIGKGLDALGKWLKDTFWEGIKYLFNIDEFIGIWKSDKKISTKIWETVKTTLKTILDIPFKIFDSLKGLVLKIVDKIKEVFPKITEAVSSFFGKVKDIIPKIFESVANFFVTSKDFVKKLFTDKDFRKEVFDRITNMIGNVFSKVSTFLSNMGSKLWGGIKELGVVISDSQLGQFVSGLFTKITNAIGNIKTAIVDSKFGQFVASAFEKVKTFISNVKSSIIESPFGQWISGIFTKLKEKIDNWFDNNPIGQFLKKYIIDPITGFFSHIADYFKFIKSEGVLGIAEIIGSRKKTFEGEFKNWQYEQEQQKRYGVHDAILRPDGSIIETDPKDTLVALKDIPTAIRVEEQKRVASTLEKEMPISSSNNEIVKRIDVLIKTLQNISNKEPVKLTLPTMTRQDLDLIMTGGMI